MIDNPPTPPGTASSGAAPEPALNPLELTVHYPAPRAAVLQVCGELDALTCVRFAQRAAELLDERPDLIIDLSQVTFMGSSGLQVLIATHEAASARHGELHVVTGEHRIVVRALTITALNRVLALHPDLDNAIAALPTP